MANTVSIVIQAIDQVTATTKKINDQLDVVSNKLSSTNIAKGVFGGMAAFTAAQQGISMVTQAVGSFISAANQSAAADAQLNAVLKSTQGTAGVTAEAADKLSLSLMKQSTFDDEAIKGAESLILTFTNIKSNIFPETTQAVLDMATAMHEDLQSAAIQIGKALNDPIKGMTALQRVGVTFNETQKETVKHLVETGHALDAQKIILAELNKEFGGSAANSVTTFQGRLTVLEHEIDNVKEKIGLAIEGGFMVLWDTIDEHQDDISKWVDKVKDAIEPLAENAATMVSGVVGVVKNLLEGIGHMADFISDLAHGRWSEAWDDLKAVGESAMKMLVNAIKAELGKLPGVFISAIEAAGNAAIHTLGNIGDKFNFGGPKGLFNFGDKLGITGLQDKDIDLGGLKKYFNGGNGGVVDDILGGIGDTIDKLAAKAGTSTPPIVGLGDDIADLGGGAKDTGKKIEDAIAQWNEAVKSALSDTTISLEEFTKLNEQAAKDKLPALTEAMAAQLELDAKLTKAHGDAAEAAYRMKVNTEELKDALATSGDAVQVFISDLATKALEATQAAFGSLVGKPTKEEATLQLQIAKLDELIAGANVNSEPARAQNEAQKKAIQDSITAEQARIKSLEDSKTAQEAYLKAQGASTEQIEAMKNGVDQQIAVIQANIDKQTKQTTAIDANTAAMTSQWEALRKQLQDRLTLEQAHTRTLQAAETLADQSLLTDAARDKQADALITQTSQQSFIVESLNREMKDNTIPNFQEMNRQLGILNQVLSQIPGGLMGYLQTAASGGAGADSRRLDYAARGLPA